MSDLKQGADALLSKQVSRRAVLAGGLAAGAAAFVAATGVAAQSPSPTPEPTPAATGDGSFAGVMLQGFSGGYSMNAEKIGLAAWNGATGGNATFTNVPFTEKPAVLATMIATADSNWDTIYTSDNFMARFGARILTAVDQWGSSLDLSDFYPSAISTYTASDGVLRGLPIHYSGFFTGYNKDAFSKIGVTDVPTTWGELIDLAPKFIEQKIIPCVQPWLGEGGTFAAFYWMQMYNSLGKPMFSDDRTQALFNNDEGLQTFQLIEKGLKNGFYDPAYLNTKNEHDAFVIFSQGNTATIIQGEDSVPDDMMTGWYGSMANPGIAAGSTGTVNGSDGLGLSVFSVQQEAAGSYLATQFSPEVALQVALAPEHYPPTRTSVLNNPQVQEYDAQFVPIWAVQSQGGMNRWGTPYDWNPVFDEVLHKMISGELDAAAALAAAYDGVTKVIQEWLLA
ncbi:MAG: ABC transporter substrate-binding protein [Chloroflexota bacterium]